MHANETPDSSLPAHVADPETAADAQLEIAQAASGVLPEAASGAPSTPTARRRRWQKFVRRGRPSTFNEDVADTMYESILEAGVTDSRAGLLANVSTSTVSRWKQEDPNFADFLETARTHFEFAELKKIRHAKRRDGQPNAQNAKWLLQHTNPEVWGGRARRRPSVPTPDSHQNEFNHGRFANAQQGKNPPNIPEIAPSDAPNSVAPSNHPSHVKPTIPPASKGAFSPNELRSPTEDRYNRGFRAPFVEPEWEANLAENAAPRDEMTAEFSELENALFGATQQSKFLPNVPEIHAVPAAPAPVFSGRVEPAETAESGAAVAVRTGRDAEGVDDAAARGIMGAARNAESSNPGETDTHQSGVHQHSFATRQQSKSLPNIPVIPPGKADISSGSPSVLPSNLQGDLEAIFARRRREQKALSRTSQQSKSLSNIPVIPSKTL